jgi:hypothetical protein
MPGSVVNSPNDASLPTQHMLLISHLSLFSHSRAKRVRFKFLRAAQKPSETPRLTDMAIHFAREIMVLATDLGVYRAECIQNARQSPSF